MMRYDQRIDRLYRTMIYNNWAFCEYFCWPKFRLKRNLSHKRRSAAKVVILMTLFKVILVVECLRLIYCILYYLRHPHCKWYYGANIQTHTHIHIHTHSLTNTSNETYTSNHHSYLQAISLKPIEISPINM
jgi:hypothetical protein